MNPEAEKRTSELLSRKGAVHVPIAVRFGSGFNPDSGSSERGSSEDNSPRSLERESIGAGAAGGAAVGSVFALAVASSVAASPIIGALVGAGLGALAGALANNATKHGSSESDPNP